MTKRGAGGTSGGVGQFLTGAVLAGLGMWLFLGRVSVMSNLNSAFRGQFGFLLLTLGLGLALLFFSGRSVIGLLLTIGSVGVVFAGIVSNLTLLFMPTSLFRTVAMLALLFVGLIMVARSLRPR